MAQLICSLKKFNDYIGPKIKNDVVTITKQEKNKIGLICQECKSKVDELDAAHKHGRSRKDIIKMVLDEYETEDKRYVIPNLQKTIKIIRERYFPIENNFRFLCKVCHTKYDNQVKPIGTGNMQKTKLPERHHAQDFGNEYQKEFDLILSQNTSLRGCLRELFSRFPDTEISTTKLREIYKKNYPNANTQKVTDYVWNLAKENFLESTSWSLYRLVKRENDPAKIPDKTAHQNQKKKSPTTTDENGVKETLCENEANSWRYKIGWTSMKNRMNISELIAMIESNFDCYPAAFKSWYYHHRKDTRKQFCAIKTNKNDSEICFRVDPRTFSIRDPRIIHNKRWFFSEGKEKRIRIVPENYDLIMKCMAYSFEIC